MNSPRGTDQCDDFDQLENQLWWNDWPDRWEETTRYCPPWLQSLSEKLMEYRLHEQTVDRQKTLWAARPKGWWSVDIVLVGGWWLVIDLRGPVLFSTFIRDLDEGAGHTLSGFADDTKPEGVADALKNCWAKCKVLHLGRNYPWHQFRRASAQLESRLAKKVLWIKVNAGLTMSQQQALEVKASGILDCIRRSIPSKSILALCSALVRPKLECWAQF